eukprot:TRINITY_DN63159_c0_g1_i1.p1 TRINITY_DN63159_c0_g1~~TRINITY_DN63159_c0_g1_i1.p1  ORF type:complete len:513 (-),score=79.85 TRINITY_DN63159_c0_g1_i1:214-1752(-)
MPMCVRGLVTCVAGGCAIIAHAGRIDAEEKAEQGTVFLDFSSTAGSSEDSAGVAADQHSDHGFAEEWRSMSRRRSERESYFHPRGSRYSHQADGGLASSRDHYHGGDEHRQGLSRHFHGMQTRENGSSPSSWLEQVSRGASDERANDDARVREGREEGLNTVMFDGARRGSVHSQKSATSGEGTGTFKVPDDSGDEPKIEMKYGSSGSDYGESAPKAKEEAFFGDAEKRDMRFEEKKTRPEKEFGSQFAFDTSHDAPVGWREGWDSGVPPQIHGRGFGGDASIKADGRSPQADDIRGGVHFASLSSSVGHSSPGNTAATDLSGNTGAHCSAAVPSGKCNHEGLRCEYVDDECGKNDNLGVAKAIATCITGKWGVVEVALACPPQPETAIGSRSSVEADFGRGGSFPSGLLQTDEDVKLHQARRESDTPEPRRSDDYRGDWGPPQEKAWRELRSQHGKGRPIATRRVVSDKAILSGSKPAMLSTGEKVIAEPPLTRADMEKSQRRYLDGYAPE